MKTTEGVFQQNAAGTPLGKLLAREEDVPTAVRPEVVEAGGRLSKPDRENRFERTWTVMLA